MITIIHGDDISASRNYYLDLKSKQNDSISLNENFSISDLAQNTQGSQLFSDPKSIFIENLLTKSKKTDELKKVLNFISDKQNDFNFFLWEPKEISKKDVNYFKNAESKVFKLPKKIFLFLDSLKPNNSKTAILLFHETLTSGIPAEMILFMMQRQLRLYMSLVDKSDEQIDEIGRMAPWQKAKIEKQAQMFDLQILKAIFKKLFLIEIGYKTGSLPLSLSQSIDILLLEI
jgi:DNA polymerase III delta subunit